MNFRKLGIVIEREYLNKVKKKSFLLITFGVPVLFAAMYLVMILIMFNAKDSAKRVAVVDESGIVLPYLDDTDVLAFHDWTGTPSDSIKNNLKGFDADILLTVSPLDSASKSVSAQTYSEKPVGVETVEMIQRRINSAVEAYRIGTYGIDRLDQIMDEVKADVSVVSYTVDDSGRETLSQSEVYMIISLLLGMMIYMFIAMFCGMVMTSVIEEKASRVVEVLVSSVKATELMFGKIIGVAFVALTQFFLWIVLTLVIISGINLFGGFGKIIGDKDPEAAMEMVQGVHPGGGPTLDLSALSDTTAVGGNPSGAEAVLGTLSNLNYPQMIVAFVLFFIFGYLLYASFFAAIGSAVENEADTQQLQIPVTIPLLLAFFVAFYAFKAPDSPLVWWCSMIPFTSPIVMIARIPFGVPAWELALSIGILVATVVLCAWISAKIYKVGILMYGKKSTFKDLWNWFKMK